MNDTNQQSQPVDSTPAPQTTAAGPLAAGPVLYPDLYVWCIFLASLDIMLTWIVLYLGGAELNVVAGWVVVRWGLPGMAAFKLTLMLLVICNCEIIGRRNDRIARRLAEWAVALNAIPVTLAFVRLLAKVHL